MSLSGLLLGLGMRKLTYRDNESGVAWTTRNLANVGFPLVHSIVECDGPLRCFNRETSGASLLDWREHRFDRAQIAHRRIGERSLSFLDLITPTFLVPKLSERMRAENLPRGAPM